MSERRSSWALLGSSLLIGRLGSSTPFLDPDTGTVAGVVLLFLLAFVVPPVWAWVWRTTISSRFAVDLLLLTTSLAILGTVLVQQAEPNTYLVRYGQTTGQLLRHLGFDDLYHSTWFSACLTLLGLSQVAVLIARLKRTRLADIGFLFVHIAIPIILVGGLIGRVAGAKGRLTLEEGEVSDTYRDHSGRIRSLPVTLRLDDVGLTYYDEDYRLYLYESRPDGPAHRSLTSWRRKSLSAGVRLPGTSTRLRARPTQEPHTLVLEIQRQDGMRVIRLDARAVRPAKLAGSLGRSLVFEKRPAEIRSYFSAVTLLDGEREIGRHEIRVNHRLARNGFSIYQEAYHPDNPNRSTLQIVYDPGLTITFLGFGVLCLGACWSFAANPRWTREAPWDG